MMDFPTQQTRPSMNQYEQRHTTRGTEVEIQRGIKSPIFIFFHKNFRSGGYGTKVKNAVQHDASSYVLLYSVFNLCTLYYWSKFLWARNKPLRIYTKLDLYFFSSCWMFRHFGLMAFVQDHMCLSQISLWRIIYAGKRGIFSYLLFLSTNEQDIVADSDTSCGI